MKLEARIKKLLECAPLVELTDPIEQGFLDAYYMPGWGPVVRYIKVAISAGRMGDLISWAQEARRLGAIITGALAAGRIGELIDAAGASGWLGDLITWARVAGWLDYLIDGARESGRLSDFIAAATPEQQAMICDEAGIEK